MDNTEIFVEGRPLDVQSGLDFSFNYQVTDVRNPETRSTEFTKTLRCAGTTANNELFGNVFDVSVANAFDPNATNVAINFNPNKKAAVQVMVDTAPVFDGVIQLRKVLIIKDRIEYEVVLIGRLSNLFTRIADYKLNGKYITNEAQVVAGAPAQYASYIDCSDLDHSYTRPTMQGTWTAPIGEGIVYPLIDYGTNTLFYQDGRRVYHVEDMRPAIYLKDIIDRIFAYAQCTYECALFNTSGFKRLIVPLTKTPTRPINPDYEVYVEKSQFSQNLMASSLRSLQVPFFLGDHDNYRPLGGGGYHRPRICFETQVTNPVGQYVVTDTVDAVVPGLVASQYEYQIYQTHRRDTWRAGVKLIFKLNGTSPWSGLMPMPFVQRLQIVVFRPPGTIEVVGSTEFAFDLMQAMIDATAIGPGITYTMNVEVVAENVDTYAGDAVFVVMDGNGPQGVQIQMLTALDPLTSQFSVQVDSGFFYAIQNTENLFQDEQYLVNTHLPDISMKELLVSVFRMFNLQLTPSKDREDHYIIETWREYYANGTLRDWTYKLDHNSPIELIPMGLLSAREYLFQYRPDNDYYNNRYQSNHGRTYGSRRFEIDNDFVPKKTTVEVAFSATPINNDHGSNRLIPKIYDQDIEEGAKPTDANVRVLYYAGLLPSLPNGWRFRSGYPPATGLDVVETNYPYAGHLNHPITPTFDLSWGIPFELYYGTNAYLPTLFYTNSNLFNEYHIDQYREIVDKDSKLMVAMFHLTPLDIMNLDFRDTIAIDGVYWRLNRVMDYNPFKDGLTKVELLKVLQLDPFKKIEVQISGKGRRSIGSGTAGLEELPNVPDSIRQRSGNLAPAFQGTVKGTGNEIDGTAVGFNVSGDRNKVGAGTTAVTIVGSDNVVADGLHNVTILSTNGATVTRSNVHIVNGGEVVLFGDVIEGGKDEVRAITAQSPIYTIDGGEDTVTNLFADYRNILN